MAVDAIRERITSTVNTQETESTTGDNTPAINLFDNMTSREIIDLHEEGALVPPEVLDWALEIYRTEPNSPMKYKDAGIEGNGKQLEAVSYVQGLEAKGMNIFAICEDLKSLTAEMEERDLQNITKIAKVTPELADGASIGDDDQSEVGKLLKAMKEESFRGIFGGGEFRQNMKVFNAMSKNSQNELDTITESLEDMQSVLSDSMSDAEESREYGGVAILVGQKLKMPWILPQYDAEGQGKQTVKTAKNTKRLAKAVAKDHKLTVRAIRKNVTDIGEATTEANNLNQTTGSGGTGTGSGGGTT